jgi:cyclopropane-fatty-acyl-phospholipid synthase
MWEFYLVSVGMMFRTGSQMVFQLQVAKQRDASPLTRDYIERQESVYIEAGK